MRKLLIVLVFFQGYLLQASGQREWKVDPRDELNQQSINIENSLSPRAVRSAQVLKSLGMFEGTSEEKWQRLQDCLQQKGCEVPIDENIETRITKGIDVLSRYYKDQRVAEMNQELPF